MNNFNELTAYEVCLNHARADRVLRTSVSKQLDELNITMMEWLLLGVVCNGSNDGVSMSSIAKSLDVTLPQVTALTNKVLQSKLVRQKTQATDRRSRHIMATAKGKTVLEESEQRVSAMFKTWVADKDQSQIQHYIDTVGMIAGQEAADLEAEEAAA